MKLKNRSPSLLASILSGVSFIYAEGIDAWYWRDASRAIPDIPRSGPRLVQDTLRDRRLSPTPN